MTSLFVRNNGLSRDTLGAYTAYCIDPGAEDDRLHFYYRYLVEVVPYGVTVHHIPADRSRCGLHNTNTREEIVLLTPSGGIFMSGLVSNEKQYVHIEQVAGSEAYTKWLNGDFVPDDYNWRFFIGVGRIGFYNSRNLDEWYCVNHSNPIDDVDSVAAHLQLEFDKLEYP